MSLLCYFFLLSLDTSQVLAQTKDYDKLATNAPWYIISGIDARTSTVEDSGDRNIYENNKEQQKYMICPYWIAQLLIKKRVAHGGVDPFSVRFVSKCPKAVEIHSPCNDEEKKALNHYAKIEAPNFVSVMVSEPKTEKGPSYCRICHTGSLRAEDASNLDYRIFFRFTNL